MIPIEYNVLRSYESPRHVPSSAGARDYTYKTLAGQHASSGQEPYSVGARDFTLSPPIGTTAAQHQVPSSDGARDNTFNRLTEPRELEWQICHRALDKKIQTQDHTPALLLDFDTHLSNGGSGEAKLKREQIMAEDLRAGAPSSYYWQREPGEVNASLPMHGAHVAPPGWTCCFLRSEGRYYYRRDSDGFIQWEYPVTDYTDMQMLNALPLPDMKPKVEIKPPLPLSTPPVPPPLPAAYTGSAWLARIPSPPYEPRPRGFNDLPLIPHPIDVKPPLPLTTLPSSSPLPPAHTRSASLRRTQKPFYNNSTPLPPSIEIKPVLPLSTTPASPPLPAAHKRSASVEPTPEISSEIAGIKPQLPPVLAPANFPLLPVYSSTAWLAGRLQPSWDDLPPLPASSEVPLPLPPSPSPSNPPLPPTLRDSAWRPRTPQSSAWYGLPPLPLSDESNPPQLPSPRAASPPLPPAFTWYLPPSHECDDLPSLPYSDELKPLQPPSPAPTRMLTKRKREDIENENDTKIRELARKK